MRLQDIKTNPKATHRRKRLGSGESSGKGKTSGKGHKGQKARSGGGARPGFEGGQMPLFRRLPKRGFLPYGGKTEFAIVNVGDLSDRFAAGSVVDPDALAGSRLIHNSGRASVKVLGDGDVGHALTVRAHKVSEGAKQKIEAAGGRVEILPVRGERAAK